MLTKEQVINFRLTGELPSISGGRDNPPDRYIAVPLTIAGDIVADLAAINAKADEGYRISAAIPGYVLMGNYKENK